MKSVEFLDNTRKVFIIDDILYSYTTPVATIKGKDLLIDDKFYSNTTSRHINLAAKKLGLTKKRVSNLFGE